MDVNTTSVMMQVYTDR